MAKRRLRLDITLDGSREPVFALDAKHRVVFFNKGCVDLCGWPEIDVLGLPCQFANEPARASLAAVTAALAPPEEVYAGEIAAVPKYFINRQSGQSVAKMVYFHCAHDERNAPIVIGFIADMPRGKVAVEQNVLTQVHAELGALRHSLRQRYRLNSVIAKTPPMLRVIEQINAARQSMLSVAISGEAGTGKEHVARAIHYESEHGAKALVPIDCQHLPAAEIRDSIERLVGSDWTEITPVSALHPGCLYLKHVEYLPRELQQRLLDFFAVETGKAFRQQVRLIVSSEHELSQALADERLSEAFYFQVTGLQVVVPPLRERLDELRLLAQHFVENCNRTESKQVTGISADVWPQFEEYSWPGNLDELWAVIYDAHAACKGTAIQVSDLPLRFRSGLDAQSLSPSLPVVFEPLQSLLDRVEKQHVEAALQQAKGHKTNAAKLLGLSRVALNSRLIAFGIGTADGE